MAANTSITFSLQTKDWEALVGIMSQTADSDLLDIIFQLMTYYRPLATKPAGTTLVPVTTTEGVLVKLTTYLYGNTVMNVYSDNSANMMNRIMTAVRAANNVADNYITTQLALNDTGYNNTANAIKKSGRKTIMILQYDNN